MNSRLVGIVIIAASLALGIRQANAYSIPQSQEEARALIEGCSLEDVIGDHNPQAIGIWGGKLTHESWFLRLAVGNRDWLDQHLNYFWMAFDRLPNDLAELHSQGFFPISGLDPVTGEPYRYGSPITGPEDFLDIVLETSVSDWLIVQQGPCMPEGEWFRQESHVRGSWWPPELVQRTIQRYPNITALRGAHLSWQLDYMLMDYAIRRNQMPTCGQELLDDLWIVDEAWAQDNPDLDWTQPGAFIFGTDESSGMVVAIWRDDAGTVYKEAYAFSPWPTEGWQEVPDFYEYIERTQAHPFNVCSDEFFESVPSNYAPELRLWTCSLPL